MTVSKLPDVANLNLGVNWRGFVGSVTMREGEAQDALDFLPREDGAAYKTFGWPRINDTALTGRPIGSRGFTYRGKNVDPGGGNTARTGNFGLADDGAIFTRRDDELSGFVVLTTSTFYFWNAATEAWASVALPAGVTVDPDPKPTILVFKENLYIVGWATRNLRYDPTDRALYRWGWEAVPAAPGGAVAAGGTLTADTIYRYRYTYFDVYTGEETAYGAELEVTTTEANRTVNLTFAAYAGSRHFNTLAIATDSDVGIVVYRSEIAAAITGGEQGFYSLTTLNPGTLALTDNGLAVDTSIRAFEGTMQDEPRFSAMEEFRGRFYALARKENSNRLYHSDFTNAPFVERWRIRAYKDLPVPEGDALSAVGKTDATTLVYTRNGAFRISVIEGETFPQLIPAWLPWGVGCVGPRARNTVRGWDYFCSDRGPYRWREGLVDPQWIGELVSPMFTDPLSGMCKLSETAKELTEVSFEEYSNTVRFIFAIGDSTVPNIHLAYWIEAERVNSDYRQGWWPQSPRIQTMDPSAAIGGLDADGRPPNARNIKKRLVFGDENGYMYQYELGSQRGGLKPATLASGNIRAGSTATVLNVDGGLYTNGDGLTGMRLEVLSGGVLQEREIASNTANTITVTEAFDTTPTTGTWWVGGIPAYWRSWVDHMGDPMAHKKLVHLYLGHLLTDITGEAVLDVMIGGGDFPTNFRRTRTSALSAYQRKVTPAMTYRYFTYEFANTRPDEPVMISFIQREAELVQMKRIV